MSMLSVARQARPEITLAVCRGACRLMRQAGHSVLLEVPLPDGRRADIFAVGRGGDITIVEVKSSIEDWRVDAKWPDYLGWCDQLYFAVPIDFPQALIPEEIGLIVADAYGGEVLRHPPRRPMAAARRKSLLIDCARLASERLARLEDPDFVEFRLSAVAASRRSIARTRVRRRGAPARWSGRGSPRPCGCGHRP